MDEFRRQIRPEIMDGRKNIYMNVDIYIWPVVGIREFISVNSIISISISISTSSISISTSSISVKE